MKYIEGASISIDVVVLRLCYSGWKAFASS